MHLFLIQRHDPTSFQGPMVDEVHLAQYRYSYSIENISVPKYIMPPLVDVGFNLHKQRLVEHITSRMEMTADSPSVYLTALPWWAVSCHLRRCPTWMVNYMSSFQRLLAYTVLFLLHPSYEDSWSLPACFRVEQRRSPSSDTLDIVNFNMAWSGQMASFLVSTKAL